MQRRGPLVEGLDVPRDLDLGERARALEQLKVHPVAPGRGAGRGR
ncbi:hypothetical protein ACFCW4_06965 [Streptomyces virginiae]